MKAITMVCNINKTASSKKYGSATKHFFMTCIFAFPLRFTGDIFNIYHVLIYSSNDKPIIILLAINLENIYAVVNIPGNINS